VKWEQLLGSRVEMPRLKAEAEQRRHEKVRARPGLARGSQKLAKVLAWPISVARKVGSSMRELESPADDIQLLLSSTL
jgi:hypothetical protein